MMKGRIVKNRISVRHGVGCSPAPMARKSSGEILLLQSHSTSHRRIGRTFIRLNKISQLSFALSLGLFSPISLPGVLASNSTESLIFSTYSHLSPSSPLHVCPPFPFDAHTNPLQAPSTQPDVVWSARRVLGWWPFQPWYQRHRAVHLPAPAAG